MKARFAYTIKSVLIARKSALQAASEVLRATQKQVIPVPTINRADGYSETFLPQSVIDILAKVFLVGSIVSALAFGYLIYGLFSGALATAGQDHMARLHALQLVQSTSGVLNASVVVTLVCALVLYYENEALAVILLVSSVFLAFGLNFLLDFLAQTQGQQLNAGAAANATLLEIKLLSEIIGVPGILLFLWNVVQRVRDARYGHDLTTMSYGKDAKQEEVRGALIGAFAKCWQLPFCREGIRVNCPIYHAKTKCWKQRVGCMCEENVLRLAMGGEEHKPVDMTKEAGFIPIGDLLVKSEASNRPNIPMKNGPRGVKIPTNPHLTEGQKRDRCRNCVIYNEHQRAKYGLLSPAVTLAVPILVFLNFDLLKDLLSSGLKLIDQIMGHLSFTPTAVKPGASDLSREVNGSLPITAIIIMVLTLLVITWALRFLEYCMFKIKI